MNILPKDILAALDKCCESYTFPMLDHGYIYLAATRLSLYRSPQDWAIVIEVFGFAPRAHVPEIRIYTFGSRLRRARSRAGFASPQAYQTYLANNEHNESACVHPIEDGNWIENTRRGRLARRQDTIVVRGRQRPMPELSEYAARDIVLEDPPNVLVYEFCRGLAAAERNSVLATAEERRACIPPELEQVMQLDEWNHPDLLGGELPSSNETFKSLAEVLVHGDVSLYRHSEEPNTHWKNWPHGGSL